MDHDRNRIGRSGERSKTTIERKSIAESKVTTFATLEPSPEGSCECDRDKNVFGIRANV